MAKNIAADAVSFPKRCAPLERPAEQSGLKRYALKSKRKI